MIALDRNADTFPVGLAGTPFEEVYRALRIVAATVWDVDPLAYRAGMAWGWYALHDPAALAGFRDVVTAALISEIAPMVKDTQTDAELVEYLRQWRSYTPTFPKLQAIYALFGVVVDIQPISDPEGQALLPVDDTRLAFYIFVLSMDWARPMLLGEIAETARRASPLGARPFVIYFVEGFASVPVAIAPTDGFLWVDVWESAVPVAPPAPVLPTVSTITIYTNSENHPYQEHVTNTTTEIVTAYTYDLYTDQLCTESFLYDSNSLYIVGRIVDGVWTKYPIQSVSDMPSSEATSLSKATVGRILLSNGKIWYVINAGISYFTTQWSGVCKVCSSNQATVITVYDSSNVAYNAFKFTASGTDYYYVLDGTQTDWTDDLSSIGYRLPETGWFNSSKTNVSINYGGWKHIVDTNGNRIAYDSTKVYTLVALYNENNASVTFTSGISIVNQLSSIALVNYEASIGNINVAKVYYTVS